MSALRKKAGLSQQQLADQLRISRRMVAYYEGETNYAPAGLLPGMAKALGVSLDELLGTAARAAARTKPQDTRLWRRFRQIERLPERERRQLQQIIDAFLEREKLRDGTTG